MSGFCYLIRQRRSREARNKWKPIRVHIRGKNKILHPGSFKWCGKTQWQRSPENKVPDLNWYWWANIIINSISEIFGRDQQANNRRQQNICACQCEEDGLEYFWGWQAKNKHPRGGGSSNVWTEGTVCPVIINNVRSPCCLTYWLTNFFVWLVMLFVTGLGFEFFYPSLCLFSLLLNWEKWKLLEIYICVVNRMGWSQDRQRSQAGLHNPLPAWPWALEEVRAASGTAVPHRWGTGPSLPQHSTYANSAKQLSCPPSVPTKVLPLVSHSSCGIEANARSKET